MVRGCVFPNCSNKMTRNTPQSFHRLPVGNRSVLKKWLGVLQMDTDASVHALRHADYRVCSDHFEREDYCQPHRRRHPIPKHFFLKKYAVPRAKELTDRLETSSGTLAVGGAAAAASKATSSSVASGNGNWDGAGGMDQITVVRIDDTHIAEEQSHDAGKGKDEFAEYYDMEYSVPGEDEVEEEEDSVFVIEYSNPEEEGESYQFTMSVDRSLPAKKPADRHPVVSDGGRPPLPVASKPSRPRQQLPQKRKLISAGEVKAEEAGKEEVISNKSVLELGENYSDVMEMNSGAGKGLMCTLCPPPGRLFKRGSGLAVHLKQMHLMVEKKTFFCTWCQQRVRSQIELDAHTKRHANQEAVFTCHLCPAETEDKPEPYKGSRMGLKAHLEKAHPGVIPRCDICNKGFRSLVSYLADQFRHVGKSPYYCGKCQIYEMTERGLSVHIKNHNKRQKQQEESAGNHLPPSEAPAAADNSATDDSDF